MRNQSALGADDARATRRLKAKATGPRISSTIPAPPIRYSMLGPNDELERPAADSDRALCAHNIPGAHSAPPQLSRPLQAMVRCLRHCANPEVPSAISEEDP